MLECVPDDLAKKVTAALSVPVIGIGSGPYCDGQVLVTHDILGLSPRMPPFARQYAPLGKEIQTAVQAFADDVRSGVFPVETETDLNA